MTDTIATRTARGRPLKGTRKLATFGGDLAQALREQLEAETQLRFPSKRYQQDPVAFCREILGVELWSRQIEVIEAIRDNKRVAVSSGHKVSKSFTIACVALWYFCSFEDARVVLSSTTARQVDQILWRELKMRRARGGRCVDCLHDLKRLVDRGMSDVEAETKIPRPCPHSTIIEGQLGELARTGLKQDFREIVGFTAKEAEAVAGVSGKNLLYLLDEASGIPDEIFEAIQGNRAGGAKIALFSNPTKTSGEFFSAFHEKANLYVAITISSEETPNAVEGRDVIPGLATREWIDEVREEYGEDSPWFLVRVKGKFATKEDGRIFSIARITEAEQLWEDTVPEGRLYIGVDPAGPTGSGDETAIAVRRGSKVISIDAHRALNEDGILVNILGLIGTHRLNRDEPKAIVVIDREGAVGAGLYGRLRQHVESTQEFELVPIRASDRAVRNPKIYDRMRDELAANLEAWFRDGGSIPEDAKLNKELHLWEWARSEANGRYKLSPSKEDARKVLKRSPDRFDALALSVWEPLHLREGFASQGQALQRQAQAERDPYTSQPGFSRGGARDPYRFGWGPRRRE